MEIKNIDINKIVPFKNHPYKVLHDESFNDLKNSIRSNGLLSPIIVRPTANNKYEIISGHRRYDASKLNGAKEIQCIVRNLDMDKAIINMVDSNLQRESILPSERALAYKMKLDVLKSKENSASPLETKQHSIEEIGKINGDSRAQVYRYIRLVNLNSELLQYVDNSVSINSTGKLTIGIRPAVELSYLSNDDQEKLAEAIEYNQSTPSLAQAMTIRRLAESGKLTNDKLDYILNEEKGNQHETITFNKQNITSILPKDLLKRDKW